MARIQRVGHVVLRVTDVDKAESFYRDALGMETVHRSDGAAFMSFGTQHHDIGLFSVRGEPTRGNAGLGHVALAAEGGMAELEELHQRLLDHGVEIANLSDHSMTKSIYIKDPDGNGIELFCNSFETAEEGLDEMRRPGRKNAELVFS